MPTTYTHHRFGRDCLGVLPEPAHLAALAHPGLYGTGTHGPDIFFYYRAVCPNRISAYGSALHHQSARLIFTLARRSWTSCEDKDAMLAYLLGFLTHFTLDSTCHGYVNSAAAALGVSHNRLEAVYDAHMMRLDGRTPTQVCRAEHLEPTAENAAVIARVFDMPERTVLSALRGQERIMRLLYSPDGLKKRVLRGAIRFSHLPGDFDGLFIDDETPPELSGAIARLDELYAAALSEYPTLVSALMEFLDGRAELPERFERDFE